MATLGKISTGSKAEDTTLQISTDESICGLIFDISTYPDVFDNTMLAQFFGNNAVVKITNFSTALNMGVSESLMNGVPYYHIKQYYDYLGTDKELYIMFADMVNFIDSPIELMMMGSNCRVFQIGVWSKASMFTLMDSNTYGISSLVSRVNDAVKALVGEEGIVGYPSLVNVMLCGGTGGVTNYNDLPDLKIYDFNNISIFLGQDCYSKVSNMLDDTQVGMLGIAMACLSLAGAEESIAYVNKFNLNKEDRLAGAELNLGGDRINIDSVPTPAISGMMEKGYIFPVKYEGIEGGVYFCSDDTMTDGDYRKISINRISHKCKRVIKQSLINNVSGIVHFDRNINTLSSSSVTIITNQISGAIDVYMINSASQNQLAGYVVDLLPYQEELDNDVLKIDFSFVTLETQEEINFVENYKITE